MGRLGAYPRHERRLFVRKFLPASGRSAGRAACAGIGGACASVPCGVFALTGDDVMQTTFGKGLWMLLFSTCKHMLVAPASSAWCWCPAGDASEESSALEERARSQRRQRRRTTPGAASAAAINLMADDPDGEHQIVPFSLGCSCTC